MASEKNVFATLNDINVNGRTEKKNGLTYLSWAWAWAEVMKAYPDATYEIWKDEQNRPYMYDDNLGYMVFTKVTIQGQTREMWLPVMDGANRAMKCEPYTYTVKSYGKTVEKTVAAATMTDINKTVMRCLVKNLAMFGLGLYIYAGEDLPEAEDETKKKTAETAESTIKDVEAKALETRLKDAHKSVSTVCKYYGIDSLQAMNYRQYDDACRQLQSVGA